MRVIRQAEFRAVPWKNGGGITREVWRVPADGRFSCRLSMAEIERSGPFSDFAGYDRTLVLLRGHGLRLIFGAGPASSLDEPATSLDEPATSLNEVGACVRFDGASATRCELSAGPCTDLNLMVSQSLGGARAAVERLTAPRTLAASPTATVIVFAVQGSVVLNGTERAVLEPWDCAIVSAADSASLEPAAELRDALVFLATVDDNSPPVNA